MKQTVLVLSGIPGCGKSTLAEMLASHYGAACGICSADNFWSEERPFNPAMLAQAHSECLDSFVSMLRECRDLVIVDNTNIHRWERYKYKQISLLAESRCFYVPILTSTIKQVRACAARTIHGVPKHTVATMALEHEFNCGEDVIRCYQKDGPGHWFKVLVEKLS